MSRISTKNAARIRRGIEGGIVAIRANNAGIPTFAPLIEDDLERRAYIRTLMGELRRIAFRSLRKAAKLRDRGELGEAARSAFRAAEKLVGGKN